MLQARIIDASHDIVDKRKPKSFVEHIRLSPIGK